MEFIITGGSGQAIEGCFIPIDAPNRKVARTTVVDALGDQWSMLYESREEAGVDTWSLDELTLEQAREAVFHRRAVRVLPDIAESVMGWRHVFTDPRSDEYTTSDAEKLFTTWQNCVYRGLPRFNREWEIAAHRYQYDWRIWTPHSDASQWLTLLHRIERREWRWSVYRSDDGEYGCFLNHDEGVVIKLDAPEPGYAVCLAVSKIDIETL